MPPLGRIHPSHQEPMVAREPYPTGASMDHSAVPPTIPIGGTPPLIPMRGVPPSGPIVIQPAAPMQVPQPAIPSHPPSRADLRSPHEHGMTEMPASPRRTHPTPQLEHSTQLPAEPPVIVPGSPSTYSPRVVTLPVETYDYDPDEYYYPSRRRYYYDDDEYYYPRQRRRQHSPYYDNECNHFRCRYRHPDSDEDEDPHDPRRSHRRRPPTEEADLPHATQLGGPQVSPGERNTATLPVTRGVPRTPAPLEPPIIDHGSPSTYVPQVVVLPEETDDYDSDDYYYPRHRRHYYGPCRRRRYYDDGDYDYPRRHPHYYDDDDDYYYPRWRRRRRSPYYDNDYVYRPRRLPHRDSDPGTHEDHDEGTQRPIYPAVAEEERREEREAEPHEPERRQPDGEDSHRGRPNGYATYSHGPGDRDYDRRCRSPSLCCLEKHRKGDTRTPRRYRPHSPTQPTIIRSDGKHNDGLHRPVNISRSPQSPRPYTVSPRIQYERHFRRVPRGEPAIPRLPTDIGERHPHYPATPVPGSVVEPRDVHVHDYRRTSSRDGPPPPTIVQRDDGRLSSGIVPHVPAPPTPEHGMPGPEDAQLADVLRERHGRLNDAERELTQIVHEAHDAERRRDDEFRSNEEARQQIFLDSEARRDAEARQRSDSLFQELEEKVASVLPIPDPPPCDADQHSIIESIRTSTHDAASRHAADVLEIVRMERELLEKEREANAAERERARAELETERQRLDETRKARIRELEEDLSRIRAELDNERQLHLREADEARSAAAQRDAARDGQIQELLGIVTRIAEEQNAAKQREEDAREANEGKLGIEQVLEDLARQNAEQRELLHALSETWRTDNQRQHEESIDTIRATANEQVPYNVQEYLDEFSKALAIDVRMLLGEVGKLREERSAIQHEVGLLMLMRAKYVPGGEFHGDWQPLPMGGGPPPGAPSQPPPDMPVPEEPRQPIRTCWRPVSIRPTRRIRKRRPAQPPQAEAHISPPRHTQSWETWHHEPQPRLLMDRRQTMGGSPTPDASPWQYDYRRTPSRGSPPTIVERDGGCSPSEIARDFSAPPMPEHGMPGPEAHDTEERPKDEFRSSGEARQQILLDSEARRDAEARQENVDEDSLIEIISTAASHVASRHSGDAWEIVRGEPELLEEEREANAAEREHAHAAKIHELEEGLNRVLAELDSERQLRTTESDEARSAAAEPDEALRNQSTKITNLVQPNCEENMAASEDIREEKQYWKTERDGQIQELPGIVTETVASAKRREVDTGQANEGKPDIEQVIDDLERQTAEQRELLNALSESEYPTHIS
ncbi:hypothetical protein EDD15DRAFT_844850 [Pisolithus albus]|nr:hypothetical protein EDD15DRAFT_844850 [Pisolithus albus]